ncbi:alpha/beta hydrolase [Thiofilum flexile]|uniref:alpha/beta hydrolase n=1 Tax=Thiofilum flexile TaxID=125627 RepID=UPI00035F0DE0|nr:alpha/beta fold hydrolase [Thiofilum flexile]
MKIFGRALRQTILGLLLILSPTLWALNHWTDTIFTPPRRPLLPYHQERLNNPTHFALKIQSYGCLQGKAPCLIVESDPHYISNIGKRIRRQVGNQNPNLAPYGKTLGTVVLLHGRKGRKEDLLPVAERFAALGLRCLLIDLPAHGASPLRETYFGATPFERQLPRLAFEDAARQFNWPKQPAFLWGISMGGAFAVAAASETPNYWNSLIVVSSFDQMERIMLEKIPQRLQFAGIWARAAIDQIRYFRGKTVVSTITPAQWAQHIQTPTLVVHGDHDQLIGVKQGQSLYEAVGSSQKRWVTVAGAGHRSVLSTPMPLYAEMGSWLLKHL